MKRPRPFVVLCLCTVALGCDDRGNRELPPGAPQTTAAETPGAWRMLRYEVASLKSEESRLRSTIRELAADEADARRRLDRILADAERAGSAVDGLLERHQTLDAEITGLEQRRQVVLDEVARAERRLASMRDRELPELLNEIAQVERQLNDMRSHDAQPSGTGPSGGKVGEDARLPTTGRILIETQGNATVQIPVGAGRISAGARSEPARRPRPPVARGYRSRPLPGGRNGSGIAVASELRTSATGTYLKINNGRR